MLHGKTASESCLTPAPLSRLDRSPAQSDGVRPLLTRLEKRIMPKSYASPENQNLDPNKTYIATIDTTEGTITAELYPRIPPQTVNAFVFLAKQGFYEGVIFHRVIPGFMIQGGDPTGPGTGGPG